MGFIEFNDVVKTYGTEENLQYAVNHVNFSINEGEFVVILGQSGAGKSTVLNLLGGMDQATSGSIYVDGKEISTFNDDQLSKYRASDIGFIFQFYNLIPSMTAFENVALTADIVKEPLDPTEMLRAVGLENKLDKFPTQMSGGEQQRVSIARALSKNPKFLLGDEPTGALDSETGKDVLVLIQKMCRENKKTTIMVTHNANIAQCADRVIIMKNGKIERIEENKNAADAKEVEF
jgi:putative ABC transport system ATP-binding protein